LKNLLKIQKSYWILGKSFPKLLKGGIIPKVLE
jgi:hypothetical protein